MADETPPEDDDISKQVADIEAQVADIVGEFDESLYVEDVPRPQDIYYLWILWADFHVYIIKPFIKPQRPATVIKPEVDAKTGETEDVYNIFDFGDMLSTSRGEDIVKGMRTTGKYVNTVEKIMRIVISRAHTGDDGEAEPEPKVAFRGHEIGQRKGFETIVNLDQAIEVVNFEPNEWGQRHLSAIEEMIRRGYGPPSFKP